MDIVNYSILAAALAPVGLVCRGGYVPDEADGVPGLPNGNVSKFVVLTGNVGPAMWLAFSDSPEYRNQKPNPLDRWSRRVLDGIASKMSDEAGKGLQCQAVFPFEGPPYLPFQQWAQKAEPVYPSPTGPLIHPEYGLWHAYRGALLFSSELAIPQMESLPNPCLSCADKPCLTTCPVNAFSQDGYDVPACTDHLRSDDGADCNDLGCRARRACPVGQSYIYLPAQAAFHSRAFLQARRPDDIC